MGTFEEKELSSAESLVDTKVHIGSFIDFHLIIMVFLWGRCSLSLFVDKDIEAKIDLSKVTQFPLQSFWPQDSSSSCSTTLPLMDGNCHDLDFIAWKAMDILWIFKWSWPIRVPCRKEQTMGLFNNCV